MDIHKEWEQLNNKLFSNQSLINEEIMSAITSESNSAIEKIKKGLTIKSYWCLFFITGFFALMFFNRANTTIVAAIGIVNLIYIIGYFMIRKQANKMSTEQTNEASILDTMKRNEGLIKDTINFERNFFVFLTPVIVLCSMVYGRMSKDEISIEALLADSKFLIAALITCSLAVPLVYFIGNYLNKKSFQRDIDKLQHNIQKLEGVEFLKSVG